MALEVDLFPLLWWSGPIGLGVFFARLGYLIKAAAIATRLEKKSEKKKEKET